MYSGRDPDEEPQKTQIRLKLTGSELEEGSSDCTLSAGALRVLGCLSASMQLGRVWTILLLYWLRELINLLF